jgi:predicted polyphosphate/ATP-dependent NAD kinase
VRTLGLIVNPVAGIGGAVALKGSDGADTVRLALARGGVPHASERAEAALRVLAPSLGGFRLLAAPGPMGEAAARAAGLDPEVVGVAAGDTDAAAAGAAAAGDAHTAIGATTPADTREAARRMLAAGVDLILFAGGDGTARDIYDALAGPVPAAGLPGPAPAECATGHPAPASATGLAPAAESGDGRPHDLVPVIGIPAGCKIHSAVYAATPAAAGELARRYVEGAVTRFVDLEVMDIDEEAFRAGEVRARLYGFLRVPEDRRLMQGAKVGGRGLTDAAAAQSIAERVVGGMQAGRLYLIGPGTTTRAIKDRLGLEGTLLGVDAVRDGRLVARDATEAELLALLPPGQPATIVVTVIGGQGYIFGRGNQQLGPAVIRRVGVKNVVVVATQGKLTALASGRLRVDTGDDELDALLRGYRRVVTGYAEEAVLPVE